MILMPTSPLPKSATPMPVDHGGWQEPIAGGSLFRLDRMGNRFAIQITTPRLRPEPDGRIWVARLLAAIGQAARVPFPQPGVLMGSPGTPVMDTGGQAGTTLKLRGYTAGERIVEGRFFNVVDSTGMRYLHATQGGDVIVGSDGKATLSIWPMLRVAVADGASLIFDVPTIEGRLEGAAQGWTLARAGNQGLSFTITELR
ncbi:hypothetical protein PQ455_01450 [Sphingomonas naphthae]|uniref:Uncharacterized protein n=1 Tax=Sphingomonas naphthae TaxID=1813468 RepID=A0ABY7TLS5_9SPHN|nr:hypothetical protein [Sphingomonas naphthae]WCT73926.1 hypothetical protein PQ455_01450 [Sphingomonas naphthae]